MFEAFMQLGSNQMLWFFLTAVILAVCLLIVAVRYRKIYWWIALYLLEALSLFIAAQVWIRYDNSGFYGFGKGLAGYFATIGFAGLIVVSLCFTLISVLKRKPAPKTE